MDSLRDDRSKSSYFVFAQREQKPPFLILGKSPLLKLVPVSIPSLGTKKV